MNKINVIDWYKCTWWFLFFWLDHKPSASWIINLNFNYNDCHFSLIAGFDWSWAKSQNILKKNNILFFFNYKKMRNNSLIIRFSNPYLSWDLQTIPMNKLIKIKYFCMFSLELLLRSYTAIGPWNNFTSQEL